MANHPNRSRACRSREYLRAANAQYPGFWAWIDDCRRVRGKELPDWPAWCFCPMAATAAWIAERGGEHADLAPLSALAAWRMGMGVYRFAPVLAASLIETPINRLPVEVLYRLPEWCVYIEAPAGLAERMAGFFAHLEHDADTGRSELRLVLDDPERAGFIPVPLHLSAETIGESLALAASEAERQAELHGFGRLDLSALHASDEVDRLYAPCISLLLYLCADEPDFGGSERPLRPQPKKTKKGWRLFPASAPRFWEVGRGLGEQLRQAAEKQERGPVGERFGPAPHLRRAHWHTYRVGVGRTDTRLRWIHPVLVGGSARS